MNSRTLQILRTLICLGAASLGALGSAQGADARELRIGVYSNEPKIFVNAAGEPAGILIDILKGIAAREDWTLQYVNCSWQECLDSLKAGRIDLMPDVAYTTARDVTFDFHQVPALYSWSQVFSSTKVPISSTFDLEGKRIAVLGGSVQEEFFSGMMAGFGVKVNMVPAKSLGGAFELVASGAADAAVVNNRFGEFNMHRYKLVETPIVFQPSRLFYATTGGRNADLLAAIDRQLGAWQQDPDSEYFQILKKWRAEGPKSVVPPLVWQALGVMALLVVVLVVAAAVLRWQVKAKVRHLEAAQKGLQERTAELARERDTAQRFLDIAGVMLMVLDRHAHITMINKKGVQLLGASEFELIGLNWIDNFVLQDERATARRIYDGFISGAEPFRDRFEYRIVTKAGQLRTMASINTLLKDSSGTVMGMLSSIEDITERKQAEKALQESEARYRTLAEWSPDPVAVHRDGMVIYVNAAAVKAIGAKSAEDMIGKPFFSLVHPDSRELMLARMKNIAEGGVNPPVVEMKFQRADGQVLVSEVHSTVIVYDGAPAMYVTLRDISERRRSETARATLEAQLRESQKMQAIGTLAGGIAHDFNNILVTILGNVELAREEMTARPLALESLEEIRKAGVRARDLVQQILSFGRRQSTIRKKIELSGVVEESARLLRKTFPSRVTLNVNISDDVPPVKADATQVQQIIINLATNAMQAMQGGNGSVDIELDALHLNERLVDAHPALRPLHDRQVDRVARLVVCDDGPGMDEATLARIFEPFFTTKPVDEGTGLGLSVVHGIVQTHEGAIEAESELSKGTTFTIYLPEAGRDTELDEPQSGSKASAKGDTPARAAGRRVLYLDDDASLISVVARTLERRGYNIRGFTDQHRMLDALRADPAKFDLVVTDYNMPGMSGLDVARVVRSIRPDLPVVIASGFIDETLRSQAESAGARELIFKASSCEEFSETLMRLADGAGIAIEPAPAK